MKNAEDRIWDYLDGGGSPEERASLERQLAEDQALRELWLRSRQLHRQLQAMEPEMPSLRFTQNLMEKLPPLRQLADTPLVSMRWLRAFAAAVTVLAGLFLGGAAGLAPMVDGPTSHSGSFLDVFSGLAASVSQSPLMLAGLIGAGFLCLLLLDRRLQAWHQRTSSGSA